jgi:hypothetical protein
MATKILFLYSNQFDTATLTESSQATGFPAENLQNPFRTKVWRTAGAVAGTADLIIDLGAGTKSTTCVALIGYTWTSAPGTLNLLFHDDAGFGVGTHTESLTWHANPTANGNYGTIIKTFASYDERFLKLDVVYSPGAVPTDWDLGRIFIGTYFEPAYSYDANWMENFVDESMAARTIGGQDHFDTITKFREFIFSHTTYTQAQWESFQAVFNAVGLAKDLFIAFDYDNEPDELTVYGKFTQLPGASSYAFQGYNANFTFRESR